MAEKERKKRKRRRGIAPLYGKGDGKSAATHPAYRASGPSTSQGPAYPGAGGINAPGVPGGPNAGMGPLSMSFDPLGMSDFEALLSEIAVQTPAPRKRP